MPTLGLLEYPDAPPQVRAVYDDIMATRKTDWINNFWKAIAHDPVMLKRTWDDIKQIMAPGALDPLTKELIYVAVSVTNQCEYCIASHTASAQKKGMTDTQFIQRLLSEFAAYGNNLAYDPFPVSWNQTYNSNSFVSGLIIGAGRSPPNLPGVRPGYGNPIPVP